MQQVILQTPDGFNLDADYGKGTNGKGIVFVHGLANDRTHEEYFVQAAKELHKKGFSVILFDLRAHGKSTGNSVEDFTIASQLTDIDVAVQFLKDEKCKTLYLAGASFGGGAVCLYIKNRNEIAGLVLSNPVLDYTTAFLHPKNEWGEEHFGNYQKLLDDQGFVTVGSNNYKLGPKIFEEMKQNNPFACLETFTKPVYILHGSKDHILSYEDSIAFFEKLPNTKKKFTLIYGADHGFHNKPYTNQAAENIVQFFTS